MLNMQEISSLASVNIFSRISLSAGSRYAAALYDKSMVNITIHMLKLMKKAAKTLTCG